MIAIIIAILAETHAGAEDGHEQGEVASWTLRLYNDKYDNNNNNDICISITIIVIVVT